MERPSFRQRTGGCLGILRSNGINCEVVRYPRCLPARYKVLKRCADFDAVYLQKKTLNLLDGFLLRRYAKNVIFDFDDAVMYDDKQPERKPSYYKHTKPFERIVRLSKLVIAGNSYLAELAGRFNPNVEVLPTGLDIGSYKLQSIPEKDNKVRLVWIGSKSTLKYLACIKPALEEVGRCFDNVVLRIICDDFFDLENMEVERCRWSLSTQAYDLAMGDIGLSPLEDNRFTRGKCGFKILQYAAAGLAVVASPVGVNAEYVQEGVTGFCASDTQQWIDRLSRLIENAALRKQMAQAGSAFVENFDINVIGQRLCELIYEYLKTPSSKEDSQQPKVSICIPTYNRKDFLVKTLDSILEQTYKNYEIVIVDDGSTDGTADMIKKLNFPVTYHRQENRGDAAARNKLIELAKGKYVTFIDSDDLLLPDSVERMVRIAESAGQDFIVYGPYYRIDKNGRIYGKSKRKLYTGQVTKYLFQTIFVHSCGSLFPRSILKDSVAFDTSLKVCSDYDFWLRLSIRHKFIALPEPVFKRRRHPANLSAASLENYLTELKVLERFYYEKGGRKFIPEKIAQKVFSKKHYRAGRYAIREGAYDQALRLLGQSLRQQPNLKSLICWTRAVIAKKLTSP